LSAWTYQPTAGLTSTCPQTEVKVNLTRLGTTYGQHVETLGSCWLSTLELLLKSVDTLAPTVFTLPGIESGTAAREEVTLPLKYSGGH
jgi:hypothetical protein